MSEFERDDANFDDFIKALYKLGRATDKDQYFKKQAMANHPDKRGDQEKMKEINSLKDIYKEYGDQLFTRGSAGGKKKYKKKHSMCC